MTVGQYEDISMNRRHGKEKTKHFGEDKLFT